MRVMTMIEELLVGELVAVTVREGSRRTVLPGLRVLGVGAHGVLFAASAGARLFVTWPNIESMVIAQPGGAVAEAEGVLASMLG